MMKVSVLVLGLFFLSASLANATFEDEFIGVASDNWHFETKTSHQPFVPFGVAYVPAWAGWAPDYFSDQYWEAGKALTDTTAYKNIDRDFGKMEEMGLNITKIMTGIRRMISGSSGFGKATVEPTFFDKMDIILSLAKKHHLKVIFGWGHTWVGGPNKSFASWWWEGNKWFSEGNEFNPKNQSSALVLADFFDQMAQRFRENPTLFSYEMDLEEMNAHFWKIDQWPANNIEPKASWNSYLKKKYGTVENLRLAWGRNVNVDWSISPPILADIPEPNYSVNDQMLYDFQMFRDYNAFRYDYPVAKAIKAKDNNHLVAMGNHPYSILIQGRNQIDPGNPQTMALMPGTNEKEMARILDYLSPHLYPMVEIEESKQINYQRERARYEYYGKPILVDEFNGNTPSNNASYVENLINNTKGDVSGWIVWWFQNGANAGDQVSVSGGLIDQNANITSWGYKYKQIGESVKNLVLKREAPVRIENLNKKFMYTSSSYVNVINGILTNYTGPVDFSYEEDLFIRDNFPDIVVLKLGKGWNYLQKDIFNKALEGGLLNNCYRINFYARCY